MKHESLDTYSSADPWARALEVSDAKVGKTCFIVASALGVLPWQKNGGIVDRPENLHLLTFDSKAAGGLKRFLLETCSARPEATKINIWNMEKERVNAANTPEYDRTFLSALMETAEKIATRCSSGSPLIVVSSLTGMAEGLLNSIRTSLKETVEAGALGTGMDQNKWGEFAGQIMAMRNMFHAAPAHVIWEAHLLKITRKTQNEGEVTTESIQIPGQSGVNFGYNCDQLFRIVRLFGQKAPGTNCDQAYLNPRVEGDFISNGRNFNEALQGKPQPDPTLTWKRLGLKVGAYGAVAAKPVVKKVITK